MYVSSASFPLTRQTCLKSRIYSYFKYFPAPQRNKFRLSSWFKMNQHFSSWKSSGQLCIMLFLIRGRSNRSHDSGWLFPSDYLPEELLYSFPSTPHPPPPLSRSVLWRTARPAGQSCELHHTESMKWLRFHNMQHPAATCICAGFMQMFGSSLSSLRQDVTFDSSVFTRVTAEIRQ